MTTEVRMSNLFAQLGLDNSDTAIATFIKQNQLPLEVSLLKADIWNDAQRQFLAEHTKLDDCWAIVVDQLNESLHEIATAAAGSSR